MDQLFGAFGINWKLLIAQGVNFGLVLLALWYFLYKPVMKVLDERRAVVAKGVADAKEAAEKLASADSEAAERLNKADAEATGIVSRARQAASAEAGEIVDGARERAEALTKDAALRAAEEHAKALRESEREVARLAILAAEKVMSSSAKAPAR